MSCRSSAPAIYTDRQLLLPLALIQSWGFSDSLSWSYPSWSVSAECFCYLAVPVAALALGCMRPGGTIAGIALLMAADGTTYMTVFDQTLNQAIGWLTLVRALPELNSGLSAGGF